MLAKLASTLHKPNQQTVILLSATPRTIFCLSTAWPPLKTCGGVGLLSEFPIRRVPGLSRVLRSDLSKEKLAGTLGSLLGRTRAELCAEFGEAGNLLYDTARGVETSPVVPSSPPKSLSSSMSLTPVSTLPEVQRVFGFAAKDLGTRLAADASKFNRMAQTIVFRYRFVDSKEVSFNISARSLPAPATAQPSFAEALVAASMAIFRKNNTRISWQLRWISFTGTRFTAPTANGVDRLLRTQLQPAPAHDGKPALRAKKPAAAPIELDDSEEESAEEGAADEKRSNKRQWD